MEEQSESTRYTVVPVKQPYKLRIIEKYIAEKNGLPKASLCRFYLRGLCLLKKQYCKYGHGIDDLIDYSDEEIEKAMRINVREGTQKNIRFTNDPYFNQKALFAHEPVSYYVLWEFQQQHKLGSLEPMEIDDSFEHRNRLRMLLHEHNWQLFMLWLCKRYPEANLIVEWVEHLYKLKGFVKQHTHCKFNGLLTWLMKSGRYFRYEILIPPRAQGHSTLIIDLEWQRSIDRLLREKNPNFAKKLIWMCEGKHEEMQKEVKRELIASYLTNKQPNEKSTLCKFFMKGNCIFDEEQCKYSHSIDALQYYPEKVDAKIADEGWFVQKPVFIDKTLGYPSLCKYQRVLERDPAYKWIEPEEINKNAEVRQRLRGLLMRDLYRDFIKMLEKRLNGCRLTTSCVEIHYHNVGFGKCLSNRFQTFLQGLESIGYCEGSYVQAPFLNRRRAFIFPMMDETEADRYFARRLHQVVNWCIVSRGEEGLPVLTEQDIKKAFYELQQQFVIPLHIYLKSRGIPSTSQWLKATLDFKRYSDQVEFDFSDSVHRIKQQIVACLNKYSARFENLTDLERQVLARCEGIPLHCLKSTGMRRFLINEIISHGRQIYMFSASGEARVVNVLNTNAEVERREACICNLSHEPTVLEDKLRDQVITKAFEDQRVVIVDNEKTLLYAAEALKSITMCGVDVEGNLKRDGWIYLVQVGLKTSKQANQVLIFDIFWAQKTSTDLYEKMKKLLNWLFTSYKIIKVMQDCRQDSLAIHQLLGSCLNSVLDTCGTDIYLTQHSLYEALGKSMTYRHLSDTLQKVPGLNAILSKYGKPVNSLKEKMKIMFEMPAQDKASYFQVRPIQPDFLEYAVRDVEDLVDVGRKMVELDQLRLALDVGRLYSCSLLEPRSN